MKSVNFLAWIMLFLASETLWHRPKRHRINRIVASPQQKADGASFNRPRGLAETEQPGEKTGLLSYTENLEIQESGGDLVISGQADPVADQKQPPKVPMNYDTLKEWCSQEFKPNEYLVEVEEGPVTGEVPETALTNKNIVVSKKTGTGSQKLFYLNLKEHKKDNLNQYVVFSNKPKGPNDHSFDHYQGSIYIRLFYVSEASMDGYVNLLQKTKEKYEKILQSIRSLPSPADFAEAAVKLVKTIRADAHLEKLFSEDKMSCLSVQLGSEKIEIGRAYFFKGLKNKVKFVFEGIDRRTEVYLQGPVPAATDAGLKAALEVILEKNTPIDTTPATLIDSYVSRLTKECSKWKMNFVSISPQSGSAAGTFLPIDPNAKKGSCVLDKFKFYFIPFSRQGAKQMLIAVDGEFQVENFQEISPKTLKKDLAITADDTVALAQRVARLAQENTKKIEYKITPEDIRRILESTWGPFTEIAPANSVVGEKQEPKDPTASAPLATLLHTYLRQVGQPKTTDPKDQKDEKTLKSQPNFTANIYLEDEQYLIMFVKNGSSASQSKSNAYAATVPIYNAIDSAQVLQAEFKKIKDLMGG